MDIEMDERKDQLLAERSRLLDIEDYNGPLCEEQKARLGRVDEELDAIDERIVAALSRDEEIDEIERQMGAASRRRNDLVLIELLAGVPPETVEGFLAQRHTVDAEEWGATLAALMLSAKRKA